MPVRRLVDQSPALRRTTAWANHVGFRPRFVDEHEPFRVEPRLEDAPPSSRRGHVGPILLGLLHDFFLNVIFS